MWRSLFIAVLSFVVLNSFVIVHSIKINLNSVLQDSTQTQRFIVNVLSDYDKPGRWIFVKVERCNNKSAYEIVSPLSLYMALAETNSNLDRKLFVNLATETLFTHNTFASCIKEKQIYFPKATYEIEGRKVNMKKFNLLKKIPIEKILNTYFDRNRNLKKQFKKELNELIAVCYVNNVKIITSEKGSSEYQVFK